MNVVEVIAEYLLSNRKLVVPNLGAFMVKESGERIFSDLLRADDGVLTSLLQAKGLSDMEAAVSIDRFVFETRHELESYGYCRLGDIGTLRIEPETKVLRLYEPVYGEIPKQTPYVPEPVVIEEETESDTKEVVTPPAPTPQPQPQPQQEERKSVSKPMPKAQPRKRVDFVMIFALVILVLALAGIAYGVYVSTL
ncbi:MAG: hypothetical protein IIV24_03215 [Alistipes sp.]|nr:hypothetical protein [Alistipes sp.]